MSFTKEVVACNPGTFVRVTGAMETRSSWCVPFPHLKVHDIHGLAHIECFYAEFCLHIVRVCNVSL